MKLVRMRQAAVRKPEFLVEAFRIDNERIPFPPGHRTAVVKRIIVISTKLALLRTAICINDAIVTIATSDEYEDALAVSVFCELNSIGKLELTRPARRHAI